MRPSPAEKTELLQLSSDLTLKRSHGRRPLSRSGYAFRLNVLSCPKQGENSAPHPFHTHIQVQSGIFGFNRNKEEIQEQTERSSP